MERDQSGSKKAGILLPHDVYSVYERIARDEHITVAQVIARVAIEFAEVEREASRSRRTILDGYKEESMGKTRPVKGTRNRKE